VLDADQLSRGIALGTVPVRVDAEGLDVDTRAVHLGEAVADIRPQQSRRFERMIDDLRGVRNDAMGMHVDRLDTPAGDDDFPAPPRMRVAVRAATAARTSRRAGGNLASHKSDVARHISGFWHITPLDPYQCVGSLLRQTRGIPPVRNCVTTDLRV